MIRTDSLHPSRFAGMKSLLEDIIWIDNKGAGCICISALLRKRSILHAAARGYTQCTYIACSTFAFESILIRFHHIIIIIVIIIIIIVIIIIVVSIIVIISIMMISSPPFLSGGGCSRATPRSPEIFFARRG